MAKKALLVGINNFKYTNIPNLRGCHNDVTNMRHSLMTYFGFDDPGRTISVLIDERATRDRMRQRMEWLFRGLTAGDHAILHMSTHGSQIRDFDGDERHRRLDDELDEIVCLYDMNWDDPDSYLVDDEFRDWIEELPDGVNLSLVFDLCHSGTATRNIGLQPPPYLRPAEDADPHRAMSRFVNPPVDIAARVDERRPIPVRRALRGRDADEMNHILISACADFQTASDAWFDGFYHGALTYHFCRHIRAVNGRITYDELVSRVRQSLQFDGFSQTPQLEGPGTDRDVFV